MENLIWIGWVILIYKVCGFIRYILWDSKYDNED